MKTPLLAAALVAMAVGSGGCYPDRLDSANYDIVATVHDSTGNFTAATYALKDTVVHLVPPGGNDPISRLLDPQILAAIRTNMNNKGYQEVTGAGAQNTADLRLVAAVGTTDYTQYYWDYWCGIYWYGCYYPPYYGTYTYTVGTLFIGMQDRRVTQNNKTPLIWLGIGNGLLGTGVNATRVTGAIDQMFDQSPYIQP